MDLEAKPLIPRLVRLRKFLRGSALVLLVGSCLNLTSAGSDARLASPAGAPAPRIATTFASLLDPETNAVPWHASTEAISQAPAQAARPVPAALRATNQVALSPQATTVQNTLPANTANHDVAATPADLKATAHVVVRSQTRSHAKPLANHRPVASSVPNTAFEQAFMAAEAPVAPNYSDAAATQAAGLHAFDSAGNHANAYTTSPTTDGQIYRADAIAPRRLGDIAVRTEALMSHLEPSALADIHAKYDAVNLRTSVSIPAFRHSVHVSLDGGYEHLVQPPDGPAPISNLGTGSDSADAATSVTGTSNAAALNSANRLDLSRTGYSATASVPLAEHLNVGVGYSQHDVRGDAGITQGTPIDQRQELYTGSVTYAPRGGRSSITVEGGTSRAIDNINAVVDSSVKRGNVLFSVKF